jgi:tetratricopeptide (TPR) repeat protein
VTLRATRSVTFALLAGVLAGAPAMAAPRHTEVPRHELSEAAAEPFQRGLAAAQQQDWKLAMRYLTDAQKADPDAPEILFNLGLASSKLPGYELRSMAWFQAYLLADPNAANAQAVRSQLLATEIAFESKIGKILEQLEPVAALLQTAPMAFLGVVPRAIIPALTAAHNFVGDSTGAARLLGAYRVRDADVGRDYVNSVASVGRFSDAEGLDFHELDFLYEQGHLVGAQHALQSQGDQVAAHDWESLGCASYETGNREILQFATSKLVSGAYKSSSPKYDLSFVEEFLISVGNPDAAQKLLSAAEGDDDSSVRDELAGKRTASACDLHFWWGKNRRNYLIDFALKGLVLDSKNKLDDTQLDDFVRQEGALMASPSTGHGQDMTRQYDSVAEPLVSASDAIEDIAEAYRKIRGPSSDHATAP